MPAVFLPSLLDEQPARTLYVRSQGPALALAPVVRDVVDGIDPRVPLLEAASLEQMNREETRPGPRAGTSRGIPGGCSAVPGDPRSLWRHVLPGLNAFAGNRRSQWPSGRGRGSLMAMVLRHGLTTAAIGVVFGSAAATAGGVWIQAEVLGAAGVDAATLSVSAALLTTAMLVASAIPARRAARLDPMHVLRSD